MNFQKCPAIVRGELAQIQRSWAEIWYNLVLLLLQGIVSQVIRGTVIFKLLRQYGKAKSLTSWEMIIPGMLRSAATRNKTAVRSLIYIVILKPRNQKVITTK